MYKIVVIVIDLLNVKNLVISFRLLFGKKLVMDGQNFKNFVITILQVNKIDPVSWSVSQSVIQTERQSVSQSDSRTIKLAMQITHPNIQ